MSIFNVMLNGYPPSIDEYVSEDNQVRAIEDYVELLDMVKLGTLGSGCVTKA